MTCAESGREISNSTSLLFMNLCSFIVKDWFLLLLRCFGSGLVDAIVDARFVDWRFSFGPYDSVVAGWAVNVDHHRAKNNVKRKFEKNEFDHKPFLAFRDCEEMVRRLTW